MYTYIIYVHKVDVFVYIYYNREAIYFCHLLFNSLKYNTND